MKKLILILLTTAAAGFAEEFEPVTEIDGIPVRRAIPIEEAQTYDATPGQHTGAGSRRRNLRLTIRFSSARAAPNATPRVEHASTGPSVGTVFLTILESLFPARNRGDLPPPPQCRRDLPLEFPARLDATRLGCRILSLGSHESPSRCSGMKRSITVGRKAPGQIMNKNAMKITTSIIAAFAAIAVARGELTPQSFDH